MSIWFCWCVQIDMGPVAGDAHFEFGLADETPTNFSMSWSKSGAPLYKSGGSCTNLTPHYLCVVLLVPLVSCAIFLLSFLMFLIAIVYCVEFLLISTGRTILLFSSFSDFCTNRYGSFQSLFASWWFFLCPSSLYEYSPVQAFLPLQWWWRWNSLTVCLLLVLLSFYVLMDWVCLHSWGNYSLSDSNYTAVILLSVCCGGAEFSDPLIQLFFVCVWPCLLVHRISCSKSFFFFNMSFVQIISLHITISSISVPWLYYICAEIPLTLIL